MKGLVCAALAAITLAGCGESTKEASFEAEPDSAPPAETVATPAVPKPDGDYQLNCDYLLGTDGSYTFIAGGKIKNTGNVGTIIEVKVDWEILGSEPVVETRRVKLPAGQTRSVQISVPATSDQIDAHQSAEGRCEADAAMVDTFGKVQ